MDVIEIVNRWRSVRDGLFQALDKMTDAHLGFVPREGLWSLGTVARHIAESEDGWFRFVVTHELPGWPEYTAEQYPSVESVKALLSEVHKRTEANLQTTAEGGDLDRAITLPWGGEMNLRGIAWHVLEHEIHHRGEIYLMLGLQGIEAPDI